MDTDQDLQWLVVRTDDGQSFWFDEFEAAEQFAKDNLSAMYEVQLFADYGEQEL